MKTTNTIDQYIASYPKPVQATLTKIRQTIKKLVPDAEEKISYGMPTFKLAGKNLVHFAAYDKHYGFYPTPSAIEAFQKDLKKFKTSKGAIQFPIDEPIPYPLIEKIVKFRIENIFA